MHRSYIGEGARNVSDGGEAVAIRGAAGGRYPEGDLAVWRRGKVEAGGRSRLFGGHGWLWVISVEERNAG